MAKIIACCVGVLIFCFGSFALYKTIRDIGKPEEVKEDLTTTGVVCQLTATELRHRIGVTLETTCQMKYKFTDQTGETHTDMETLEAHEFSRLQEGQEIEIRYHSDNPLISASKYGFYLGVDDPIFQTSTTKKLVTSIGIMLFGLFIVFLFTFVAKDDDDKASAGIRRPVGREPAYAQ